MKLMFLNGPQTGQSIEIPPTGVTIGRESDNTIQLPMGGVSRYHAKIDRDAAGNWQIRDLGSTNGTLVNDVPVNGVAVLSAGAVISIGDQFLRCIEPGSSGISTAMNPSMAVPPVQPSVSPAPSAAVPPQQPSQQPQQNPSISQSFFFRPQNVMPVQSSNDTGPFQEPLKVEPRLAGPSDQTVPAVTTEVPHGLFKKKTGTTQTQDRSKKLLGNVVFAVIVILAACFGLWIFLKLSEGTQKQTPAPAIKRTVENPFVLYYEKENVTGSSIFRFVLQLENNQLAVTLDEPQNKRCYYELFTDPVSDELIAKLRQQIQDSGFMDLQQEKIAGTSTDNRQFRRIMVGFGNKFCDVKVSNDVSETFNRVESIINETLLEEYDLGVVSQDVDRILKDAETFLFVAEEAFRSIDTTPSNLPKAITNYKLALRRYQLFDDPKPPEWKTARDGLKKAEEKLEEIHDEGLKNVRLAYELHEYDKAIAECNRLLEIFPPDSKTYKDIRETKIKIDSKRNIRNN